MRTWVSASDRQGLLKALDEKIRSAEAATDVQFGIRASVTESDSPPKILGVFTGQVTLPTPIHQFRGTDLFRELNGRRWGASS